MQRCAFSMAIVLGLFTGAARGDDKQTVVATGAAEEVVKPDLMMVTVFVTGEGASMADAAKNAAERVQAVVEAAKKARMDYDFEPPEVFTLGVGQKETRTWRPDEPDVPKPAVNHRITFTLTASPGAATEIIDAAIQAGASLWLQRNVHMSGENNSNVVYALSDEESALARVRKTAMKNARLNGEELAGLVGKTLGNIVSIAESMFPCGSFAEATYFSGTRQRFPRKFVGTDPNRLEIRDSMKVTFEWHDNK